MSEIITSLKQAPFCAGVQPPLRNLNRSIVVEQHKRLTKLTHADLRIIASRRLGKSMHPRALDINHSVVTDTGSRVVRSFAPKVFAQG
jgi:hypothetical protein